MFVPGEGAVARGGVSGDHVETVGLLTEGMGTGSDQTTAAIANNSCKCEKRFLEFCCTRISWCVADCFLGALVDDGCRTVWI